jgi:tetratricopeptide (TPR) repeat protein
MFINHAVAGVVTNNQVKTSALIMPNAAPKSRITNPLYPFSISKTRLALDQTFFKDITSGKLTLESLTGPYLRGLYHFVKGNYEDASRYLQLAKLSHLKMTNGAQRSHYLMIIYYFSAETLLRKGLDKVADHNHALKAKKIFQKIAISSPSSLLRAMAYKGLGKAYVLLGDVRLAEANFLKSVELGGAAYYQLGSLALAQYSKTGEKHWYAKSVDFFQKVDQRAYIKDRSMLEPYYSKVISTTTDYDKRFNGEYSISNVVKYLRGKPFEEQIEIADSLWKAKIKYVPNITDSKSIALPLSILVKTGVGDCDGHIRYFNDIFSRLNIPIRIFADLSSVNIGHVFTTIQKSIYKGIYRIEIDSPPQLGMTYAQLMEEDSYTEVTLTTDGSLVLKHLFDPRFATVGPSW